MPAANQLVALALNVYSHTKSNNSKGMFSRIESVFKKCKEKSYLSIVQRRKSSQLISFFEVPTNKLNIKAAAVNRQ